MSGSPPKRAAAGPSQTLYTSPPPQQQQQQQQQQHRHVDGARRCVLCDRFEDLELTLKHSEADRAELASTVGQLRDQVAQLQASQQNSNIVVARLEDRLSDTLEELRRQFDSAMTVQTPRRRGTEPIGNQVMKTKELAAQNARELSDVFEQLGDKTARIEKLEAAAEDLRERLRNVQAMAENITRKTIENLQQSQLQVHEDLVALQQLVARKVDRRDMTLLESALERLDSFARLEEQLRKDYEGLAAAGRQTRDDLQAQSARLASTQERLGAVDGRVQRLPKREEIIALQKSLKDMLDSGLRALLKRVNMLSGQTAGQVKDNAARLGALARGADGVGARLATMEGDLRQALNGKVSVDDMGKYIDQIQNEVLIVNAQRTADIDQVCERINADAKKNTRSLNSLRGDIERVEGQLAASGDKMKILMRFVDWYAENGQNFQHNADLVERQLETLAHRSAPPNVRMRGSASATTTSTRTAAW